MAGTIVADTIQDGAGNSTSMDNAIYGSAKAWVSYNGAGSAIRSSYNVSSVTVNTTGKYTVNFTNAMPNTNYAVSCTGSNTNGDSYNGTGSLFYASTSSAGALTTTTCAVAFTGNGGLSSYQNPFNASVIVYSL